MSDVATGDGDGLFGPLVRKTAARLTLLATYLGSLLALVVAYEEYAAGLGIESKLIVLAGAAVPLLVTFVTHTVPAWRELRRSRQLVRYGVHGTLTRPGYFRLIPYDETDREAFNRPDDAHRTVLGWLREAPAPVLYLTGHSGTGKSSLLSAWVLPHLREEHPPCTTVVVRSFQDPVAALTRALLVPGAVWTEPPEDQTQPRQLLERACAHLSPERRLLLVLDQFEEFVILHDAEVRSALVTLLNGLAKTPIAGLTVLVVLRTDYLAQLEGLGLPPLEHGRNWKDVGLFTLRASREFLQGSGLEIGEQLLYEALREASEIEESQGLIRPITLNIIGVILARYHGRLPRDVEVGALVPGYLKECIGAREVREHAPPVLREMVTDVGTKYPRSQDEIAVATGLAPELVRGCLLSLANRGLVRPIDESAGVWEISHDFVARILGQILARWRAPRVWRARLWVAPVALVLWGLAMVAALPVYQEWIQVRAVQDLTVMGFQVVSVPDGYAVAIDAAHERVDAVRAGAALRQLGAIREFVVSFGAREAWTQDLALWQNQVDVLRAQIEADESVSYRERTELERLVSRRPAEPSPALTLSDVNFLAGLDALRTVDLRWVKGDVETLDALSQLPALRRLVLGEVNAPSLSLKRMPELAVVHLDGTALERLELRDLPMLSELMPGRQPVPQVVLSGLPALSSLELVAPGTLVLEGLEALTSLRITGLDGLDLEMLRGLRALRSLDLSGGTVGDLASITSLDGLEILHVACKEGAVDLPPLDGLPALTRVTLVQCSVPRVALSNLPVLERVTLEGATVGRVELRALPELTGAGLHYTRGEPPRVHLENLPALESLNVRARVLGLDNLPALESLRVREVDTDTMAPLRGMPMLRSLDVSKARIGNLGPLAALTRLERLSLRGEGNGVDLTPLRSLQALDSLLLDGFSSPALELVDLTRLNRLQLRRMRLDRLHLGGLHAMQSFDTTGWGVHVQHVSLERMPALLELELQGVSTLEFDDLPALAKIRLLAPAREDLGSLVGLPALTSLYLSGEQVTSVGPIAEMGGLVELALEGTAVSDLEPLRGLTDLEALTLTESPVSSLEALAGIGALRVLVVNSTRVTDLTPLRSLHNLSQLDLRGSPVVDLSPLHDLPRLSVLYLDSTDVSRDQIRALERAQPRLQLK